MSDAATIERLAELARKAWPDEEVRVEDFPPRWAHVIASNSEASRVVAAAEGPRRLDALESSLFVLVGGASRERIERLLDNTDAVLAAYGAGERHEAVTREARLCLTRLANVVRGMPHLADEPDPREAEITALREQLAGLDATLEHRAARIRELEGELHKAGTVIATMCTGNPKPAEFVRLDAVCDWVCSKLESGFHWIAYDLKRELTDGRLRYEGVDVLREERDALRAENERLRKEAADTVPVHVAIADENARLRIAVERVAALPRFAGFWPGSSQVVEADALDAALGDFAKEGV